MTEALLVSNVVLWVLVVALLLVVVALTRQIGLLHERVAPVGALAVAGGPEVGEAGPELAVATLDGPTVQLGGADPLGRQTLLFFLSPTCPVCKTLLPTLQRISRAEGDRLQLVYASDGDAIEHEGLRSEHDFGDAPYVLSRELGLRYEVAKLPYAVLLDAEGIVRAKGIVNTREHLESLFEAERLGVASLQQYLSRPESSHAELAHSQASS